MLNATESLDPDDRANNEPFAFQFACTREDDRPCFGTAGRGNIQGGVWTIPGSVLTTDKGHTFTVLVQKGRCSLRGLGRGPERIALQQGGGALQAHERSLLTVSEIPINATPSSSHSHHSSLACITTAGSRSATATLEGVRPRAASVPTGTVLRACGAVACPPLHSTDQPLSLTLQLPAAFAAATVQWSSEQVALASKDIDAASLDLTIPPTLLPRGGAVTVEAALTLKGETGTATLTVPVNSAPYCADAAGACLSVDTKSDVFPGASFVATAANIADDAGAFSLRWVWGPGLPALRVCVCVCVCVCKELFGSM